jgi:ACDE family multidrug resistance protein
MPAIAKKREHFHTAKITVLSYISLIASIGTAAIMTIWALYIDSFLNSMALTGLVSTLLTIISFVGYFALIPVIEKSNKGHLFAFSLVLTIICYFLFLFVHTFLFFLMIATALTLAYVLRISSFGIVVKDKSKDKDLAKNEGLFYTCFNIGYVIGPLIAAYLLAKVGFSSIFILGLLTALISLIFFQFSKIKDVHISRKTDKSITKNFYDFFREKERVIPYVIKMGISLWWVLIYVFMPLYIVQQGLKSAMVGYFLFAIAVPLILAEYKFSKLTSRWGYKKLFRWGFVIPLIAAVLSFFTSSILLIMIFLTLASFGLAMTESTIESYFLSIVKKEEINRYFPPFNTSADVGAFIAKLIASLLIVILPFKSIFLLFALFMFIIILFSNKIKEP